MTNCIIPFCISYTINKNQALMANPLFWHIPPFSRNDKIFVQRGIKGVATPPHFMPQFHRTSVFPSEESNFY